MSADEHMANELTKVARKAFRTKYAFNTYSQYSPRWYAFTLGRYLQESGRPAPTDVRELEGGTYGVRDMRFEHMDHIGWRRLR